MPNTTTPASVATRLSDLRISTLTQFIETRGRFQIAEGDTRLCDEIAAVLRDYVRMRKLANAVIDRIKRYHANLENPMCAFNDIKCAVAEAEKGGAK